MPVYINYFELVLAVVGKHLVFDANVIKHNKLKEYEIFIGRGKLHIAKFHKSYYNI